MESELSMSRITFGEVVVVRRKMSSPETPSSGTLSASISRRRPTRLRKRWMRMTLSPVPRPRHGRAAALRSKPRATRENSARRPESLNFRRSRGGRRTGRLRSRVRSSEGACGAREAPRGPLAYRAARSRFHPPKAPARPAHRAARTWGKVKRALWLLWPPLLAVLVYAGALGNPFVYDDHAMVVGNPSLGDLANPLFVLVYQPFRPLVNVSYALDYALWGLEPFGYHLTGLLLHALNVALLSRLLAGMGAAGAGRGVAAFAAALFAVHPLGTETVGYVAARAELLCSSFFLASLLCFRSAFALASGAGRRARLAAGVLAFAFALACKEVAAVLPLVLALYDLAFLPPGDPRRRGRFLRFYLPMLAVVAAGAALRLHGYRSGEDPSAGLAFGPNLMTQFRVIWLYAGLFFLPRGLSLVHEVPELPSFGDAGALWAALAGAGLLAVALLAWRLRRFEPRAAFGVLWFLILLIPSSAIPLPELAAEHRTYLAGCGLALAVAALLGRGLPALALPPARERTAAVLASAAILAALSLATAARNRVWSDPVALWADAARKAPRVFAPHYQLGDALRVRGECAAAIPAYARALELVPDHLDARNHLGICLAETGHLAEARQVFESLLARDPGYERARNNLRTLSALESSQRAH